ncbi:type III-B CRISPR module RAMP protein Cmr1 [Oleidesulfovibrio alaskensis]
MPDVLTARFTVSAPMFLRGATADSVRLRELSIKGVLRFWWRALAWSGCHERLVDLHDKEAKLFGSVNQCGKDGEKGGKGLFTMRVKQEREVKVVEEVLGYYYLAYGVESKRSKVKYISEGNEFSLIFYVKDGNGWVVEEINNTLRAFGLFGGLGARSRKGFGSVTLESITLNDQEEPVFKVPQNFDEYQKQTQVLLKEAKVTSPPFSAFSQNTSIYQLAERTSAKALLTDLESALKAYRQVKDDPEKYCERDYDLYKAACNDGRVSTHPCRAIWGLPLAYKKGSGLLCTPEKNERRASPVFFHIHRYGKNSFALFAVLMRAQFLPASERILFGKKDPPKKNNDSDRLFDVDINDFKIISDFFTEKKKNGEAFFPQGATFVWGQGS